MMQPSADEVEKKLGVKGTCRSGGTNRNAVCKFKGTYESF